MVPAAVSLQVVGVLLDFLGKFLIVRFRGCDEPALAVLCPGVEAVVAKVLLGRSGRGALGSDRPLTGPHQYGTPLGGHGRNARVHDKLHGASVFEQIRSVLTLALRREGATGCFHDDVGIAAGPDEEAPGPETEPVRTVSFHVVQLGSLVQPRGDAACEAQLDLTGFPSPDAVSRKEGAPPFGLMSAEVVRPLVPDVAIDDAEIAVSVRTPGFLVGLRQYRRGLTQDKQQAHDACVLEDSVVPVRSLVHRPPPRGCHSEMPQSLCQIPAVCPLEERSPAA